MESVPIGQAIPANERYYQSGTAFSRLLAEAPYLPRCSDNKTAALVRPREHAIRYPYMQVNRQDMVSWLVFDLDHSNSLIWDDQKLPAPNFVVSNRKNGHSHLFYAIAPVCTSENARSKPIQYMKAVYEAMAARLNADLAYSGPVAKTPGHPWWSTWEIHSAEYDLAELADYVDLAVKPLWSTGPDLDVVSHSRHCLLFEELRFYAYSIVNREKERGTFQSFMRLLEAYAFNKNNYRHRGFTASLTLAQVKATVKSVARWTWTRYTGSRQCHRGVMNLDKNLPLKDRQKLAAERTHQGRQKATESKIRIACHSLQKKGLKLTQVALAKATGLARQTIAKYKYVLNESHDSKTSTVVSLVAGSRQSLNVNYGLHQITGSLGDLVGVPKNTQLCLFDRNASGFDPPD